MVLTGDLLMLAEPTANWTPLYPWFLAIIRSFSGLSALLSIVIAQGFLLISTIVIAGHVAARITKLPRALPWALLVSLPAVSALTFSAAVLSETLFTFLFLLNLLAVLDYAKYGTAGRAVWVGITLGLVLLTRPIVILLWIPHIVFLLYVHVRRRCRLGKHSPWRTKLHHRVGHFVVAALTIGVLIAPWLMRNEYRFGRPVVTESLGRKIWFVTFQKEPGAGGELPDSGASREVQDRLDRVDAKNDWRNTRKVSDALVHSGLNDAQADRLMWQVSIDAIALQPQEFAFESLWRMVDFWRCTATDLPPQGSSAGDFRRQVTWERLVPPINWALEHRWSKSVVLNSLLAAMLGAGTILLIINHPTRPYAIWLALIFSYFTIATGLFEIPAYRHRIVIEPLLAMVMGACIAVLLSRRRKPAKLASAT